MRLEDYRVWVVWFIGFMTGYVAFKTHLHLAWYALIGIGSCLIARLVDDAMLKLKERNRDDRP